MHVAHKVFDRKNAACLVAGLAAILWAPAAFGIEASLDQRAGWDPSHYAPLSTRTKMVAEQMLYDLGSQRFLVWGARKKGAPVGVRLAKVQVPSDMEGVDDSLLFARFLFFARGHSELKMVQQKKAADLDVHMRVLKILDEGHPAYALRIEARATKGKARGRLLYAATRNIG